MDADCRTYLPPEWAPQSGVMLTWPHARGDWAANLGTVEPVFVDLARHITRYERLLIVCEDEAHREHIDVLLSEQGYDPNRVSFEISPSNDTWARDHGPLTVICSGEPHLLDFQFNGWGGKYTADLDNAITPNLYRAGAFGDVPMETVDLILEGGAVEVDGSGTLGFRSNRSNNNCRITSASSAFCGWTTAPWPAMTPTAISIPSHGSVIAKPSPIVIATILRARITKHSWQCAGN
jgi:agmatine/peptidylarginine deiminase